MPKIVLNSLYGKLSQKKGAPLTRSPFPLLIFPISHFVRYLWIVALVKVSYLKRCG